MTPMSAAKTCPQCSAPLPDDAPHSTLCPACSQSASAQTIIIKAPGAGFETIGDYEVLGKLGQGGMGAVYRARQISLDRVVALKVLPQQFADDDDFVARFQREARVATSFHHANLVSVYASGCIDGVHYLTMELVEGENLHQRLKRGALSIVEALRICADVARGLQYGWESAQLVHRDIKPSNIYVSESAVVKLGDLGLAKSLSSNTTGITHTGAMMGTPHYMSPEQARGDKSIDFHADIYSLGCTLYEMLAGQPPFTGADPLVIVRKHMDTVPPSLLTRLPGCPMPLARLVGKMLKKYKLERHLTYAHLIAEIEQVSALIESGEAQPSLAPTVPRQTPAPVKEPFEWTSTIIGVLILAAILVIFLPKPARKLGEMVPTPVAAKTTPRVSSIAATTPSATPAPAPAAPAFGPWQPLFTDAEWKESKPGKREVVDGRVHLLPPFSTMLKPQSAVDGAIRARIQYRQGFIEAGFFARSTAGVGLYKAVVSRNSAALLRFPPNTPRADLVLGRRTLPKLLQPGDTVLLEMRLQGDRLTVLVDDAVVIEARDSLAPGPGEWGIVASDGWFESVEVQSPLPAIAATKEAPFVNSLGMKFVPVPGTGVLFCIHETRWRDFAACARDDATATSPAKEAALKNEERNPNHPAEASVTWDDAEAFCAWLSRTEGHTYRLPTDREWSYAVGIGEQETWNADTTPATVNKVPDQFPWGTAWPPPKGAGNYRDETFNARNASADGNYIQGYDDGFHTFAPVMSFTPNHLGLYDLGGNVWEWVADWHDASKSIHTLRGADYFSASRDGLLSSMRRAPSLANNRAGFRVVVVTPAPVANAAPANAVTPSAATKDTPLENSLGMKFVPVPIVGIPTNGNTVLFSVWETRVQDYEAFATETRRTWSKAGFEQGPTHPAVGVSWNDAQAFCTWLTERERKAGRLPAGALFRLPSDHEWSCAVGIGAQEDLASLPGEKSLLLPDTYPWGASWPAPDDAGNYNSAEAEALPEKLIGRALTTRHDGYGATAPVGSYRANSLGLYDLGGNVWEWCEDWIDQQQARRVMRGASYTDTNGYSPSARRTAYPPEGKLSHGGFRVVLALPAESASAAAPAPAPATKDAPLVNSLGMKFVPVPGTDVLFCIHETRWRDVGVYAEEGGSVNGRGDGWARSMARGSPDLPAAHVTFDNAEAFCIWLSRKEGRTYRLPTDREWSYAVGIGEQEKWDADTTPATVNRVPDQFPWGTEWPPPKGAGNYQDATYNAKDPKADGKYIDGYDDGFSAYAPAMSCPSNRLGLYDLGGNMSEWVGGWFEATKQNRVMRGASFSKGNRADLLSSRRIPNPNNSSSGISDWGFRVVLVPSTGAGQVPPAPAPAATASPAPAADQDGWENLLATLTPELVAQTGHGWRLEDGALRSPDAKSATVGLPGSFADTSYQVRVKLRQTAKKDAFVVILPVARRMVQFVLDASPTVSRVSGLQTVDGAGLMDAPGAVKGKQINDDSPHDLEVTVRLDGTNAKITVALDTRLFYEWAGPSASLGLKGFWATTAPGSLALGTNSDDWEVFEVKVKPLDPEKRQP